MDGEGTPIQELAAIEVNCKTDSILDVFHAFAYTESDDSFARKHIHGLNLDYLKEKGFPSETELLAEFHKWLANKPDVKILANGAHKEKEALGLPVQEFSLLPWAQRVKCSSHKYALELKDNNRSILCKHRPEIKCCDLAHSSFVSAAYSKNALTMLAKVNHGYHCALYDVIELYFMYALLFGYK